MELKLSAKKRDTNEKLGLEHLAAVVYGNGVVSQPLKLVRAEFSRIFAVAGESNLIDLDLDGEKTKVLVKEIQKHPVKDLVRHVDLYQVNMKEEINAEIPLHFIGESKAVKELGGILIKEIKEVRIECLPGDLVDHIDVDISVINTMDGVIKISDLAIPENMTVMLDMGSVVAMVVEPKQEEEPVEAEAEAAVEGGEKVAEGDEKKAEEGKEIVGDKK
ncbi:MAG TPA: 50S ribosomal protein L25 [Patescibacteria group bacterium]|nr:50S ribosomal protein L25 [Patescibacteria group bacterium]